MRICIAHMSASGLGSGTLRSNWHTLIIIYLPLWLRTMADRATQLPGGNAAGEDEDLFIETDQFPGNEIIRAPDPRTLCQIPLAVCGSIDQGMEVNIRVQMSADACWGYRDGADNVPAW